MSVGYLNCATPSAISAFLQTLQSEFLGSVVNTSDSVNIGLVVAPVYAHKKSNLHQVSNACSEKLAACNLLSEHNFVMAFEIAS